MGSVRPAKMPEYVWHIVRAEQVMSSPDKLIRIWNEAHLAEARDDGFLFPMQRWMDANDIYANRIFLLYVAAACRNLGTRYTMDGKPLHRTWLQIAEYCERVADDHTYAVPFQCDPLNLTDARMLMQYTALSLESFRLDPSLGSIRNAGSYDRVNLRTLIVNLLLEQNVSSFYIDDYARTSESIPREHAQLWVDLLGPGWAFNTEWRTSIATVLARQMYESRDFSASPILADALQDAGCDEPLVLTRLRDTSFPCYRGLRIVDELLDQRKFKAKEKQCRGTESTS